MQTQTSLPKNTTRVEHYWFVHYNFHRRHRRIGRITPYQAVCHWHDKQPDLFIFFIFIKEPVYLLRYRSQSAGT